VRVDGKEQVMARADRASNPGTPAKKRETRDIVRIVVAVVGLVLLIAFVLDNSKTVRVGFVFFNTDISLIWVLLIAAFLGALVDRLVILLMQRRKKAKEGP
jgi:uncharacterized integral membrane protein